MKLRKNEKKNKKNENSKERKVSNIDLNVSHLSKRNNKILRYFLMFLMGFILFGIFIVAAPGIFGEKPISIDETHFNKYPVKKMIEYDDTIVFLIDKNGENTQLQIKKDVIKLSSDFGIKEPLLYIYNPQYVVYKNIFYIRKKVMEKTDKEFKNVLKKLNKKHKRVYLYKFVDNE